MNHHLPMRTYRCKSLAILVAILALSNVAVGLPQTSSAESRKFCEFPARDNDWESLAYWLDRLAIDLVQQPTSQVYVVVRRTPDLPPGVCIRFANRAKSWLVVNKEIDSERILTIDGGVSDRFVYELWIVPPGGEPPRKARSASSLAWQGELYLYDKYNSWTNASEASDAASPSDHATLVAFGQELQDLPNSVGYLVVYGRDCKRCEYDEGEPLVRRDSERTLRRLLESRRRFLIQHAGIAPNRIITRIGGRRARRETELWIGTLNGQTPWSNGPRHIS